MMLKKGLAGDFIKHPRKQTKKDLLVPIQTNKWFTCSQQVMRKKKEEQSHSLVYWGRGKKVCLADSHTKYEMKLIEVDSAIWGRENDLRHM